MTEPFEDSRRLTGCNLYFAGSGAALESARGLAFDASAITRWRENIISARAALQWPDGAVYVRTHASGLSLAFEAPLDQLYTATAVCEWAWYDALGLRAMPQDAEDAEQAPLANPGALPRDAALAQLLALAQAEAKPTLMTLQREAFERAVPFLPDDDAISLGAGEYGQTWSINALPQPSQVPWSRLRSIPAALVTGSNGKTTTVRVLAAALRAHGLHTAHSCTEGVYFDNALIEGGDFSGPGGARTALRHPQAQAAVLETARGGILRRGLALCRADVAIVTNISADHYGEYGVHDLDDLARVKLVVARAVRHGGLLILNADDDMLRKHAPAGDARVAWFAADFDSPLLIEHRERGGITSGVRAGRLLMGCAHGQHDLGPVAAMPLTLDGRATYNIANLSAAAMAAREMGVPVDTLRQEFARFGSAASDNPGRLQQWSFGDARVVVDYAHNPEGLHGILRALDADRRAGRLTAILGHAGNREDEALRQVAATVAGYRPDRIVLKDIHGFERGRVSGEVAQIMRDALISAGIPAQAIEPVHDEVAAAKLLLAQMQDGDLVVLPLHETEARDIVVRTLEAMRARQWRPGHSLPEPDETS